MRGKAEQAMLARIERKGPILEIALVASGGSARRTLRALVAADLIEAVDHPTVIEDRRTGRPARAWQVKRA